MQTHLINLLEQFRSLVASPPSILVIGDLILDEFIAGEVLRISREAPVPILRKQYQKFICGGASNAARNAAALEGNVLCVGIIGSDDAGIQLKKLLEDDSIVTDGLITASNQPTTLKTRISGYSQQSVTQQIVRIDCLPDGTIPKESEKRIIDYIKANIKNVQGILISDYNNGVITPDVIETCRNLCNEYNKFWVVDSQKNLKNFHGATLVTPNQPEAEKNIGRTIKKDIKDVEKACKELIGLSETKAVLITRGSEGMSLFDGKKFSHIPAFNKEEVFDVTGAGDTVAATLTLALCCGMKLDEAASLANLAAGMVVRKFGTAVTSFEEMFITLKNLSKKTLSR